MAEFNRHALADMLTGRNRKMTKGELARRLQVDARTVSRWLTGESQPRPPMVHLIADILEIPSSSLQKESLLEFLSDDELELLAAYRRLRWSGKARVMSQAIDLSGRDEEIEPGAKTQGHILEELRRLAGRETEP